jgi:hypothetical protein
MFTTAVSTLVAVTLAVLPTAPPRAATATADAVLASIDVKNIALTSRSLDRAATVIQELDNAPDPRLAFLELSASDRALFKATALVESVEFEAAAEPSRSARGCWSVPGGMTGKSAAGLKLYSVSHFHQACTSGSKVTSASYKSSAGQAHALGWQHKGRLGRATGVVRNQARQYVQHRFTFSLGGWVVQDVSPCSRSAATASGNVIPSSACNINGG